MGILCKRVTLVPSEKTGATGNYGVELAKKLDI